MPEYFANNRGQNGLECKSGRGGSGRGQGRHPKYASGPMKQATVRLPEQWQADLRQEFGSLQKAIETLVIEYLQSTK